MPSCLDFVVQLPAEFYYRENHGNRGDSVIAWGARNLFNSTSCKVLGQDDGKSPIVLNAAGKLVPHYSTQLKYLQRLRNKERRIVVLPCTTFGRFSDLNLFPNLTLYCRDLVSYVKATEHGIKDVRLAHDLAFHVDFQCFSDIKPTQSLLMAFRTDGESHYLVRPKRNRDLSQQEVRFWALKDASKYACRFITGIAKYSEVQTDRLLVAMVAARLGRKVTLFRNDYFKNRAVYDFSLARLENIRFETGSVSDATYRRSPTVFRSASKMNPQVSPAKEMKQPSTKTFLISLERTWDTRKDVIQELNKLSLGSVELMPAFDGMKRLNFSSNEMNQFRGTAGCYISHLKIYKFCIANAIPRALIFEDDVCVENVDLAVEALEKGESLEADLCNYCSISQPNWFINTHAYSVSIHAMRCIVSGVRSLLEESSHLHIDRHIEHVRIKHSLQYASLNSSTIHQNKSHHSTLKWGDPPRIDAEDLRQIMRFSESGFEGNSYAEDTA